MYKYISYDKDFFTVPLENNPHKIVTPLLINGILGIIFGLLLVKYQWAVEHAQVLSGLVEYPKTHTFYLSAHKAWTLINQISTIYLRIGFSEISLCYILSALAGMISFQAIGVLTFSLTRSTLVSTISSILVFMLYGSYLNGVTYAIMFIGTGQTYGMIGLSLIVLNVGFFSCGQYKYGLFLLGLSPCLHPSQGIMACLIILLASIFDLKHTSKIFIHNKWFFALGALISLLSFFSHEISKSPMPSIPDTELVKYQESIILYWSEHFRRFSFRSKEFLSAVLSLFLAIQILLLKGTKTNISLYFLSRSITACSILGISLSFVYWITPSEIGPYYKILMLYPARVLNFNILVLTPLLYSLFYNEGRKFRPLFILYVGTLLVIYFKPLSNELYLFKANCFFVFIFASIRLIQISNIKNFLSDYLFQIFMKSLLFILILYNLVSSIKAWNFSRHNYFAKNSDPVIHELKNGTGLVLNSPTQGSWLMIQTRRPQVFNAGTSVLTYVPEAGPNFHEIFSTIYGISFLSPPKNIRQFKGGLPEEYVISLWNKKSSKDWFDLSKKFGFTQILTTKSYKLNLPIIAKNNTQILYDVR